MNPSFVYSDNEGEDPMITKHDYLVTAMIFQIFLLSGCSSKDPDRYYSSKDDYSIKFPKEWENTEGLGGASVIFLSPQENTTDQFRGRVSVIVEQFPRAMELDEYFKFYLENTTNLLNDFQESEKGSTSIGDTDAKWMIYTSRTGTLTSKSQTYFIVHDKRGYLINCAATSYNFARYKSAFADIVGSFEFD